MMMTRLIAVTAFAITAAVATTSTASAAPEQADPHHGSALETEILPGIHYTASIVDKSVVLTTDGGSLTTQANQFQVLDAAGNLVAGFPLTYSRDGKEWPIAAQIDGRSATLTPSTEPATSTPLKDAALPLQPTALDVRSPEFSAAIINFGTEVALGIGIGSLIGTAIGAGIGCIAGGALVGSAVAVPTIGTLAVPGFLGGCLVTGAAAGAIGAVAGTVIVGGPVAVASALQFYDAVNAPAAEPVPAAEPLAG